jgi:hypothetical protein
VRKNLGWHDPEIALKQLCAAPSAAFGEELLARACGDSISFGTFVSVARELVHGRPDEAARWIAAMVALDMCDIQSAGEDTERFDPGHN